MKILIAAGSSGGHIFPAIATAFRLRELNKGNEILFLGSEKNIDREIFKNEGYDYCTISAHNRFFKDIVSSFLILKKFKPDIVIGFGGYVSFPILLAAKILNIPTMAHEQNLFPGLANRVLANFVDRVAISFSETNTFFLRKSIIEETGNPVRSNLVKLDRARALERFGLNSGKFTILVMGGSQGAHFINGTVVEMLRAMDEAHTGGLQIIHLCGMRDFEFIKSRYASLHVENRVFSFFDMMGQAYSACDLVISRAGATSISEITFFGKPAVLIPYPNPKVHQIDNARFLEKNGAAIVIEQAELSKDRLKKIILDLLGDRGKLKSMSENSLRLSRPDAARKLAVGILNVAGN